MLQTFKLMYWNLQMRILAVRYFIYKNRSMNQTKSKGDDATEKWAEYQARRRNACGSGTLQTEAPFLELCKHIVHTHIYTYI